MAFFAKKEKSCCGCFSVKAGTQIIVLIFLVVAIFKLRGNMESLSVLSEFSQELVRRDMAPPTTVTACMEWFTWICMSYALVFQFLPCVLAVYGAFTKKSSYLQPFILINTVSIVNLLSCLLALVGTFIIVCMNRTGLEEDVNILVQEFKKSHPNESLPEDLNERILTVIISVIGIVFIILSVFTLVLYHFICVVHTHYLKLKEEKEGYKYNAFSNIFPENGHKQPLA